MQKPLYCRDERRRDLVRRHRDKNDLPDRNGIDYVEVSDDQRSLKVFFLSRAPDISVANVRIDGGRRVHVRAIDLRLCRADDPEQDDCVTIYVDRPGDFSTYTLRLVRAALDRPGDAPLDGFDPRYASIEFSFKVGCPSDLDCAADAPCPIEPQVTPEINYLAKDYASFRQLILDRLALIMPDWRERHVPDIGIALVELLAYTGDYLSYYQDAVATEAYLDTARRRISVRRHARLVDYQLHEGCNARAWACIESDSDAPIDPATIYFVTGLGNSLPVSGAVLSADDLADVPIDSYLVFEPLAAANPIEVVAEHSRIPFYTWGDAECCLERGATGATLRDRWIDSSPDETPEQRPPDDKATARSVDQYPPEQSGERSRALRLRVGDVLIFEEVISPTTGLEADADRSRRHAVRLTRVEPGVDSLTGDPIVEIGWGEDDALPWALCLSSVGGEDCHEISDVSVARGNVVLVDHGRSVEEPIDPPPAPIETLDGCCGPGQPRPPRQRRAPYDPVLGGVPLTWAAPFPSPAAVARRQAELLGGLVERVQQFVRELWRQVQGGRALSDQQIEQLRVIFGTQALTDAGLLVVTRSGARPKPAPESGGQAAALRWLIMHEDDLLAAKIRRIGTLTTRAQSGYLLDDTTAAEIAAMWGELFAADLAPGQPSIYGAAASALDQSARAAVPQLVVREQDAKTGDAWDWQPRADLLASVGTDRHVVVEIDNERRAHLRFGDGDLGRAPRSDSELRAAYRVGNGRAGNVGAESIARLVFRAGRQDIGITRVRNPLPARGGTEYEPLSEVRMFAPTAFRRDMARAIVADDYARLAERVPGVQRAAAVLRWTGGWYDVHVAIDARADRSGDALLLDEVRTLLAQYQRIGHEVIVDWARTVPLDLAIQVCVLDGYQRGQVKAALLDVLSNRLLPDGRSGLFFADNLTFGTPIALSQIIAAVQAVPGVETLRVTRLERLYEGPNGELDAGILPLAPNEVARLDNDPNQPEFGKLSLTLRGGR